jgi:hypothetical protein
VLDYLCKYHRSLASDRSYTTRARETYDDLPAASPAIDELAQEFRDSLKGFQLPPAYAAMREPGKHHSINCEFVTLPRQQVRFLCSVVIVDCETEVSLIRCQRTT